MKSCGARGMPERLFVEGRPKALLGWIDLGGVRAPLYVCEPRFDELSEDVSRMAR